MPVRTYQVNPLSVSQQNAVDVLWNCTGVVTDPSAAPQSFEVQFWQTQVAGFTGPQLKAFVKALVDVKYPVQASPAGNLAAFQGATFTL